jgi:DNA repair protein RecO (recombination protein O)
MDLFAFAGANIEFIFKLAKTSVQFFVYFPIFVIMLHKTRGIILHSLSYNDRYSIVSVFTEEFGVMSYLVAKTKGKRTKVPKSLFHSLAVLDLDVEHQNLREIQRIKEAKVHLPMHSLLQDPVKATISLFLSEFIGKVIREVEPNKSLFDYLLQSVRVLDLSDVGYANFPLVFMIRLSRFQGFYPDASGYEKGMFFDMQNGIFTSYKPVHVYFLNPDESEKFCLLLRMNYENMPHFKFSRHERKSIIYRILEYYRLHLTNFSELKSLEILHEVFG